MGGVGVVDGGGIGTIRVGGGCGNDWMILKRDSGGWWMCRVLICRIEQYFSLVGGDGAGGVGGSGGWGKGVWGLVVAAAGAVVAPIAFFFY